MKKKQEEDIGEYAMGGQAVLEGVMLKSKKSIVVCARNPDGKIVHMKKKLKKKKPWKNWFFIRGIVNLLEMLKVGMNALVWSSNVATEEEESIDTKEWIFMITLSTVFVLIFFVALPLFLTKFFTADRGIIFNLIDGVFRIAMFVLYVWLISFSKDIKDVFRYHGAEHKAVHCYEKYRNIKKVSIKTCKPFSPIHPRCGSSFLMILLIISIIIFSLVRSENIWVMFWSRVILLPIIVGLSYEFLKFSARYQNRKIMKVFIWPGLALQKITTKEPTAKQQEVAVEALKRLVKFDSK